MGFSNAGDGIDFIFAGNGQFFLLKWLTYMILKYYQYIEELNGNYGKVRTSFFFIVKNFIILFSIYTDFSLLKRI